MRQFSLTQFPLEQQNPDLFNVSRDGNQSVLADHMFKRPEKYGISLHWGSAAGRGATGAVRDVIAYIFAGDHVIYQIPCVAKKLFDTDVNIDEELPEKELQDLVARDLPTATTGLLKCFGVFDDGYLVMPKCRVVMEKCMTFLQDPEGFWPDNDDCLWNAALFSPDVLDKIRGDIFAGMLRALQTLQKTGVVHRDLKPGNGGWRVQGAGLRLANYHFCFYDFGTAIRKEKINTEVGEIKGTPLYCAPEIIVGDKNESFASDVYSVGAILLELLGGREAFRCYDVSRYVPLSYFIAVGSLFKVEKGLHQNDVFSGEQFLADLRAMNTVTEKLQFIAENMYAILPERRPDLEILERAYETEVSPLLIKEDEEAQKDFEQRVLSAYQNLAGITVRQRQQTSRHDTSFFSDTSRMTPIPYVDASSEKPSPEKVRQPEVVIQPEPEEDESSCAEGSAADPTLQQGSEDSGSTESRSKKVVCDSAPRLSRLFLRKKVQDGNHPNNQAMGNCIS